MKNEAGFTAEQQNYLQGLALGTDVARKISGLTVLSNSASPSVHLQIGGTRSADVKLCPEERAKCEQHPLDRWDDMQKRADAAEFPQGIDTFLQKYFGMFYVAPAQDSYMCRLRFAGGAIRAYQLSGLADLVATYAGHYVDVTTRANLQMREIAAADPIHVLRGLRDLGILNLGAGADNIRNVTASPLSGLDPEELAETLPLAHAMHHHILSHREFYNLPRKFNIAFDGGGRVSAVEETNDLGFRAVLVAPDNSTTGETSDTYFQMSLGGITGHGDFARPTTVVVAPSECIELASAVVKVFIEHGNRTDRKRARLKYLLDAWGHDRFLAEVERNLSFPLRRVALDQIQVRHRQMRTAHVGIHPQKQLGLNYVGVVLPVGRITVDQMRGLARIALMWGSGDLRLTVWQNVIIPNIRDHNVKHVVDALAELGLDWKATNIRAGLVACTGNAGCKYAAANTKQDALTLAQYVDDRIEMDQPINIHLTGCHHSCAQHYMGDIGLQATPVEAGDDFVEGYHIYVGGGHGDQQAIARELLTAVPFVEICPIVVRLIESYHAWRCHRDESFAQFTNRMPIEQLRIWCQPAFHSIATSN